MENRVTACFKGKEELVQQRLDEAWKKAAADGAARPEVWAGGLRLALQLAMEKGRMLQAAGKKGAIAYVCVSPLRTSLLNGRFELRVDLYDKALYLDEAVCETYWEATALYSYFEADAAYFTKCARREVVRLLEAEMLEFLQAYGEAYFELLSGLCADCAAGIEQWECWRLLRRETTVQIAYGEYLDKGVLLRSIEEKGQEVGHI